MTRASLQQRDAIASEGFCSIDDAASFLGLSRENVRGFIDRGELIHARFGKRVMVSKFNLTRFAALRLQGNALVDGRLTK